MKLYLVIDDAEELNRKWAVDLGCDMKQSNRLFKSYPWGLQVTDTRWIPAEYQGQLKGFDYLTDEQKSDTTPQEEI